MTTIPLNQLVPAKTNVRKTGARDGIEELAASIAAHGLLTSLTVRKSARGKFTVIAGQRRYLALSILAARDQLPDDYPVLCQVLERNADATEIGLAENVVRIAMHPADQFEAFRALVDKGADTANIAARFGVPEATVAKRLKLGRVAPDILDAYREGQLSLEQVQAFTVTDDHDAQQGVWAACNGRPANPAAIRRAQTLVWTPGLMATAGAVVYLTGDGEAEVERGFTRRDDTDAEALPEADTDEAEAPCPAPSLPATLVADLTAQRTAALRVTLAQQPDVALAAVTHALARRAFYSHGGDSCLDIATRQRGLTKDLVDRATCGGLSGFEAQRGKWVDRLPGDADALWDWCLRQTQDVLLDLLAVSAAHTLDAVCEKRTPEDAPRLLHADALAKALRFDMREWFTPTAANYFGRVNRTFIIDALTKAGRPARTRAWSKMKKAELAALAEREIQGTGWLPQPLHIVADRVPFDVERSDTRATAVA